MASRKGGSSKSEGIERLGPNLFQVRVQGRDARTGQKTSRKKLVEGTLSQARHERARLAVEVRHSAVRKARPVLADYAASWLESKAPSLKPSVAQKYATSLDLHILPVLGTMRVDGLQPSDVTRYVSRRTKAGAAGNTILNELRLLRTIARDSHADGTAPRYWADRVKPPPVKRYTEDAPNLLTAPELASLLQAVPAQWRRLVTLIALTGMRWGEASGLQWGDIDFARQRIVVRRGNWKGRLVTPKTTASARVLPLPPGLLDEGITHRDIKPDKLVFPARSGQPHRGSPLRAILTKACRDAGLPRVTPHGLRRTCINLLRQVTERIVVQAMSGHVTDQMVDHYSMVGHGEKVAAQRLLLAAINAQDGARLENTARKQDGSGSK